MFSGALIAFIDSHESFSGLKKYVFNDFLKIATDGDFLISGGIAFQSKGPAMEKARSPKAAVLLRGRSMGK